MSGIRPKPTSLLSPAPNLVRFSEDQFDRDVERRTGSLDHHGENLKFALMEEDPLADFHIIREGSLVDEEDISRSF